MARVTASAALRQYLAPVRDALGCVSTAVLIHDARSRRTEEEHLVGLPGNRPCRLRTSADHLQLTVNERFRISETGGESMVATVAYSYRILDDDGAEILAFHWHRGGDAFDEPHVHVSAGAGHLRPEVQRAHIPTRGLTLADVIQFAVRDLGVVPIRQDHRSVLESARQAADLALGR